MLNPHVNNLTFHSEQIETLFDSLIKGFTDMGKYVRRSLLTGMDNKKLEVNNDNSKKFSGCQHDPHVTIES